MALTLSSAEKGIWLFEGQMTTGLVTRLDPERNDFHAITSGTGYDDEDIPAGYVKAGRFEFLIEAEEWLEKIDREEVVKEAERQEGYR